MGRDRRLGQPIQPAGHGHPLPPAPVTEPVPRDQRSRVSKVPGRAPVVDGLLDVAGLPVPGRGPPMQARHQPGLVVGQLQAQQLGEQLVVAVPLAMVVQRYQEQVGTLQLAQQLGRPFGLKEGVAQRARKALQDRGSQQEPPDLLRLAGQYLGAQIVGHMAVVAME